MSTSTTDGSEIKPLTENNFSSWFVNIRAELRTKKLWKYTQEPQEESTPAGVTKWEEKAQESADLMTPTISSEVKQRLTEAEFNNGFLMLRHLRELLQPTGLSAFIRLSTEYYTLRFESFKTVTEYLTQIKVLEERIDATQVVLNNDNRTVLCLSMSLPQEYQYLVQIWATMPAVTAVKARQMVLEASRQHSQARESTFQVTRHTTRAETTRCKHCKGKHSSDDCWTEHPEDAPNWFKEKMKESIQEKGEIGRVARKFQARVARSDDFTDGNSTRISA